MTRIEAVISDFSGVLTMPAAQRWQEHGGVPRERIREAIDRLARISGVHPLAELECGRLSESDFLARLDDVLGEILGRPVRLGGMGPLVLGEQRPNSVLFDHFRDLREQRGVRLAIVTNSVREWEPIWRSMLPSGHHFDVIVSSSLVGLRKPHPGIFRLALRRLGLPAETAVFIDDLKANVQAARLVGLPAIHFTDTDQVMAQLGALLDRPGGDEAGY
jgi:putative hydrolase of the HAD superfamily